MLLLPYKYNQFINSRLIWIISPLQVYFQVANLRALNRNCLSDAGLYIITIHHQNIRADIKAQSQTQIQHWSMLRHAGWGTWLFFLSLRVYLCVILWKNREDEGVRTGGKSLSWWKKKTKSCLYFYKAKSYMSYHEKIFTMRILTCKKLSKKITRTLLHSDSVLAYCKNMEGYHQVNKTAQK